MVSAAPLRRRARELGALLVCLLLVGLINASVRNDAPSMRWYDGAPGRAVQSPDLDVIVTGVELAKRVEGSSAAELTSDGVLVVVHWAASVHRQTARFSRVELHTSDGLQVQQRDEFSGDAPAGTAPGFTSSGSSVFEVWPDSVPDADLVVYGDRGAIYAYGYAIRINDLVADAESVADVVVLPGARSEVTR